MLVIRFLWGCGHWSWRVDFDSLVLMATSTSPANVYFCLCYILSHLFLPPRLTAAEGTEPRFMREEEEESSEEEDELTPEAQGGASHPLTSLFPLGIRPWLFPDLSLCCVKRSVPDNRFSQLSSPGHCRRSKRSLLPVTVPIDCSPFWLQTHLSLSSLSCIFISGVKGKARA